MKYTHLTDTQQRYPLWNIQSYSRTKLTWSLIYNFKTLNHFPNLSSNFRTQAIYRLPHKKQRNENSHNTSADNIRRPMDTRSYSCKRSYQRKYNQNSSKSEEFFVLILYPSQQWNHRDTHTDCRMVRRKTRTRQKLMKNSFFFEISQSKDYVWSNFIYKKLDSYIYQDTASNSHSNIHRRHFMIQSTFHRFIVWAFDRLNNSISIQRKQIDRVSEDENISENRNPLRPKNTGLHPRKQ